MIAAGGSEISDMEIYLLPGMFIRDIIMKRGLSLNIDKSVFLIIGSKKKDQEALKELENNGLRLHCLQPNYL